MEFHAVMDEYIISKARRKWKSWVASSKSKLQKLSSKAKID